jgi:hypothetical protein
LINLNGGISVNRRLLAGIISVLAISAVLAACGSDDESLTKAAFIKKGDAICKRAQSERIARSDAGIAKLEEENRIANSKDEAELIVETLPPIRAMAEDLADLGTPDEGASEAEAIAPAFEEAVDKAEADPAFVSSGEAFAKPDRLAEEYGFTACSEI